MRCYLYCLINLCSTRVLHLFSSNNLVSKGEWMLRCGGPGQSCSRHCSSDSCDSLYDSLVTAYLDALVRVVLDGGDGGHDGGRPEPVGDLGEVGEVSLEVGVIIIVIIILIIISSSLPGCWGRAGAAAWCYTADSGPGSAGPSAPCRGT